MTLLNIHSLSDNPLFETCHRIHSNLQQQIENRRRRRQNKRRELQRVSGAVEAIIEGTDARVRGVRNCHRELRDCARNLLDHVEGLVDSLPSAILVDSSSLSVDPLVRILFSDMDVVRRLLIRNPEIEDFFSTMSETGTQEVYALLFIRHRERTVLGSEARGEIILREVRQTTLQFFGHRLIGPSPTEEDARFEMLITLFESVVRYIKDGFLAEKKALITRRNAGHGVQALDSIINPRVYLRRLIHALSEPQRLIRLENKPLRLSKLGIKLELDSPIPSDLLRLHELRIGDEESCVVSIIHYPRDGLTAQDPVWLNCV